MRIGRLAKAEAFHFHAIAMPGVLWCPLRSHSDPFASDPPALARSSNASKTAGYVCFLASFALAPPTGVEPATFGSGNRKSLSAIVESGRLRLRFAPVCNEWPALQLTAYPSCNESQTRVAFPLRTSTQIPTRALFNGLDRHCGAHFVRKRALLCL